jgi:hypothetical protein
MLQTGAKWLMRTTLMILGGSIFTIAPQLCGRRSGKNDSGTARPNKGRSDSPERRAAEGFAPTWRMRGTKGALMVADRFDHGCCGVNVIDQLD